MFLFFAFKMLYVNTLGKFLAKLFSLIVPVAFGIDEQNIKYMENNKGFCLNKKRCTQTLEPVKVPDLFPSCV